jgi:NodT family efflux transporter outer membrane factor (OMF) lipoprotein
MRRSRAHAIIISGVLIAGCSGVGPDYERPKIPVPRTVPGIATPSSGSIQVTQGPVATGRYWEVFHDAELVQLVDSALDQNQDLRASLARVMIARSVVREQFAPLLPKISVTGTYAHVKLPKLSNAPATGGAAAAPLTGQPFEAVAGFANLSYEVDLWGRIRRQFESANASEVASEEDRKAVELTVIGDTIQTYFDLCEAGANLAIAHDSVAIATSSLAIVSERFEKGLTTELELRRARALLAQVSAEVPEAELDRATAENKLAVLVGHTPDLHVEGKPPVEFTLPPSIPVGVPADLLGRRPDVRAAEARLASSNAQIGSVIAEFFPKLSLIGYFGNATIMDFKTISNAASQFWIAGPSLSLPIFQGGLTYARYLEAKGHTAENEASYRQTILRAFSEVATSVAAIGAHERERDALAGQVAELSRAVELADVQYRAGFVTFLDVLDAQRVLLAARQSLVRAQRQILGDIVTLQRALGGGWREVEPDDFLLGLEGHDTEVAPSR